MIISIRLWFPKVAPSDCQGNHSSRHDGFWFGPIPGIPGALEEAQSHCIFCRPCQIWLQYFPPLQRRRLTIRTLLEGSSEQFEGGDASCLPLWAREFEGGDASVLWQERKHEKRVMLCTVLLVLVFPSWFTLSCYPLATEPWGPSWWCEILLLLGTAAGYGCACNALWSHCRASEIGRWTVIHSWAFSDLGLPVYRSLGSTPCTSSP